MKLLNDFSLRLLAYREDHHLSKAEFAEMLGVDKMTILNWENGRANPRYDTLVHICRTLKIPVIEMFPIDCI